MSSIVEIRELEFAYNEVGPALLKIPQFSLASGEKVFVYGPSGSGKTTFLELVAGVLSPRSGRLVVADQNLAELSSSQRDALRAREMGYIFQSFNLIPYLTARENIELPIKLTAVRPRQLFGLEPKAALERLCEKLGIASLLDRGVTEMSVGQQQRVAAARALIGSPRLLLADEPTSALDQDHREKFIQVLFEVCREAGTSVLFVSHDRTLEKLFDRSQSLLEFSAGGSR